MLYLYLPMTMGAQKLYYKFIRPLALKHQQTIDQKISGAAHKVADSKFLIPLFLNSIVRIVEWFFKIELTSFQLLALFTMSTSSTRISGHKTDIMTE